MAAANRTIDTRIQFDGEREYKAACKEINNSLKVLSSEMRLVTAEYGANSNSMEALTKKQEILRRQYDEQSKKVQENERALATLRAEGTASADTITRFEVALNNSRAALAQTSTQIADTQGALNDYQNGCDSIGSALEVLKSELNLVNAEYGANSNSMEALTKKQEILRRQYDEQSKKVQENERALATLRAEGTASADTITRFEVALNNSRAALAQTSTQIADTQGALNDYQNGCDSIGSALEVLKSELNLVNAEYGANSNSMEALTKKQEILRRQYDEQSKKVQENERALATLRAEGTASADTITRFEVALNNSRAALAQTANQLEDTETAMANAGNEADNTGSKFTNLGGTVATMAAGIAAGMAAIAGAIATGIGYAITVADDLQGAMNDFQAATGISGEAAEDFEDVILSIYNGNYGEGFEDVAAAVAEVTKSMQGMSPEAIENVTTSALTLRDTFGYEITEQMRAANMLINQFGLTGDEAFNLIAQGAQNGLDKNEDLLDTINEYSVHFAQLGFSSENMFNMLANGAKSGTFSVDKLGDSVKEFGIRVKDGTANDAFTQLGLEADATAAAFARGGEEASAAFANVTSALFEIKDPLEQNALGVTMFGTAWEDLGADGVKALSQLGGEISLTTDAMGQINNVKYNTAGEAFAGLGRIMQTNFILPMGEELLPLINEFAQSLTASAQAANGDISLILDAFNTGIANLSSGLSEKLPEIAGFASQIIMAIVNGIVGSIPLLIEAGMQIVLQLGTAIGEALPELIPKIVELVTLIAQTIVESIPLIVDCALELVLGLANGVIAAAPVLIDAVPTIIQGLVAAIVEASPLIMEAGIELISALVGALPDIIASIVEAIPQIIDGIVNTFISGTPGIIDAGIELLVSLVEALPTIITDIVRAIPQIINSIVNAFVSNQQKIIETGIQLFVALVKNLPKIILDILKAVPVIVGEIVSAFGKLDFKISDIGVNMMKGVWKGISSMAEWLNGKISDFFSGVVDNVKGVLGIHSPSKVFENEVGKNIALGSAVGIEKNADKAVKAAEKMAKDIYESAKLWIKDYQNSTEYLANEEIKMWEILGKKYSALSKEKIEIDENIAKLQQKIIKDKEAAEKAAFDHSQKWIDENKKMNRLSMAEEVQAWERVQQRYAEGTELRKQADQQLFDAQKRLFAEQEKITSKMEAAEDKYAKAVDNRANAIFKSFGLFEELKKKEEISSQTLTANLKSQVEELKDWSDNIQRLAEKGIDDGLLAELREMSPKASAEIAALSQMTDAQLENYQNLWKEKNAIARELAIEELKGLRNDANTEIAGLNDDLAKLSASSANPIGEMVVDNVGGALTQDIKNNTMGLEIDNSISKGMVDNIKEVTKEVPGLVKTIINAFVAEKPHSVNQGIEHDKYIGEGMISGISNITIKIPQIVQSVVNKFQGDVSKFNNIGVDIMRGIGDGIISMSQWLDDLLKDYINDMVKKVEERLEINSPSKVFAGIGKYMAEGLGEGFVNEMHIIRRDIQNAVPVRLDIKKTKDSERVSKNTSNQKPPVTINQNFYTPQYDYVAQQREAAKNFKNIARAF